MYETITPGLIALGVGFLIAFAATVPYVAVQFRRRGALGIGPVVLGFGVLVYALALVTYTVLPLPDFTPAFCRAHPVHAQLTPFQFVDDIRREGIGEVHALVHNRALVQVAFNVFFFVPLGMFARYVFRRGIGTTVAIGFFVSLLIETSQLTGVWFLAPCPYRLFDVDDLIANTFGAALGILFAPLLRLVPRQVAGAPHVARPVTRFRRLLGMFCDWFVMAVTGLALAGVYVVVADGRGVPSRVDDVMQLILLAGVPAALQLVVIVGTRRSIGEAIVRLRPSAPATVPRAILRWALGCGGYAILSALDPSWPAFVLGLVSVVAVVFGRTRRGFAFAVVRWGVEDDRLSAVPVAGPRAPAADDHLRST